MSSPERIYATRSRHVLCIVINARTNRERETERNSDEKIKRIDSPPGTSRNRIFSFSLLSKNNSLSSSRSLKKERTTKMKALNRQQTILSLFLPYFLMFLYTNTYTRGKIYLTCCCCRKFLSNDESAKKAENTKHTRSPRSKDLTTFYSKFPHNNKTENTNMGVSILYI